VRYGRLSFLPTWAWVSLLLMTVLLVSCPEAGGGY
jgi:hypothetical protein